MADYIVQVGPGNAATSRWHVIDQESEIDLTAIDLGMI